MINNTFTNASNMNSQQKLNEQKVFENILATCTSKTADAPKGYLVHQNPIQALGSSIKDTGKDIVNLGHTLKTGEGNDHNIGRFNDLGMKVGGVLIASYLAIHKAPLNKKLMEFIGTGAFFASMALWPKIAINAPLKARFGFDIGQKYVDSQGRKQRFFQDPQYLPWDVWDKEKLNEVGDKMGIDKNINDREELIKKKMRTVALQGNTLWMLTAGFATPLMTAMLCNRLEEPLEQATVNWGLHKAEKQTASVESFLKAAKGKANAPGFDYEAKGSMKNAVKNAKEGKLDAMMDDLANAFHPSGALNEKSKLLVEMPGLDAVNISRDLKASYSSLVAEESIGKIAEITGKDIESVKNAVNLLDDNAKGSIFYDTKGLIKHLEDTGIIKGEKSDVISVLLNSEGIEGVSARKLNKILSEAGSSIDDIVVALKSDAGINIKIKEEDLRNLLKDVQKSSNTEEIKQSLGSALEGIKKSNAGTFMDSVKGIYNTAMKPLKGGLGVADDAIQSVNNSLGREYKKLANVIFKAVKASDKQLDMASRSTDVGAQTVIDAFIKLAKEGKDEDYVSLIKKITNIPLKGKNQEVMLRRNEAIFEALQTTADGALAEGKELLKGNGLKELSNIADIELGETQGLFGAIRKAVSKSNIGANATRNRVVLVADGERRISSGLLEAQWKQITGQANVAPEEMKSVTTLFRDMLSKGTMSSASNGFGIETTSGKFYQNMIDLAFAQSMDKSTMSACTQSMIDELTETRVATAAITSSVTKYASKANFVDPKIFSSEKLQALFKAVSGETMDIKYQRLGQTMSDLFSQNASQMKNSKNWMKIFGTASIVLVAVTLFAQLFFGKVKDAELYGKKDDSQGAVNGNK